MTAQTSPFSQYRLSNAEKQPQTQTEQTKVESPFSQYRLEKPEEEESTFNSILRHGGRSVSRILEQLGGAAQDTINFVSMVIDPIIDPLLGKIIGEENVKKGKEFQESTRILPTSKELKEKSIKASKGFTEPKNEWEKSGDEYSELVGQLLGPMKWRKALGVAALGSAAKEATKALGFGEGTQDAAKFGTTLIASMFNPKGVKNLYNGYYDEAAKHIAPGTTVSAGPLQIKLNTIENQLLKGLNAPSEKVVLDTIGKVKSKISNGRVNVEDLIASKRSLNEIMGDPAFLQRGRTLFTKVGDSVDGALKLYHNPDFIRNYRAANEAFSGFSESQKLSRWMTKLMGGKPLLHTLFATGAEVVSGHPEMIAPTLGLAAGGAGVVKGVELMQRIMSNKTLRKYYMDMLINGIKQNTRGAISNANKLEKSLEED